MTDSKPRKKTSIIVWVILGLLVFAFGGFGVQNFGGSLRTVGTVGDSDISVDEYFLALRGELNAISARTGSAPSLATPEGAQLAQSALSRLIQQTALENETARLGLSVGDEQVRDQVLATPAFRGIDGRFDREAYTATLRENNLSEKQFEENIRTTAASDLTAAAVGAGLEAPSAFVDAMAAFYGERRDILWLKLEAGALPQPVPTPTEAELQAQYEAAPAAYTAPEMRKITYAALTPEVMATEIVVDEAELRALYDQRAEEFDIPERRLVERLVMPDQEAAEAARAALDAGTTTFEALVTERGLRLTDIDLGDVARDNSDLGAAGEAIFARTEPGIVGPAETPLGPALFRVNQILPAESTPFEDVRDQLAEEIAIDRARREIASLREDFEDRLAGGATLEELADETPMELGTIEMEPDTAEGMAAYAAFRDAAMSAAVDDIPEIIELEDGGLVALRLDQIVPPTLRPLDAVRDQVAADWTEAETEELLLAQAEAIRTARAEGRSLLAQGLVAQPLQGLSRSRPVEGLPASLVETAFDMQQGQIEAIAENGVVHLVELTRITPEDPQSETSAALRAQFADSLAGALRQDASQLFLRAIQTEAGITLNQTALDAVRSQFP